MNSVENQCFCGSKIENRRENATFMMLCLDFNNVLYRI